MLTDKTLTTLTLFQFSPAIPVPLMILNPPDMFLSEDRCTLLLPLQNALLQKGHMATSIFPLRLFRTSHSISKIATLPTGPCPVRVHFSLCPLFFSLILIIVEYTIYFAYLSFLMSTLPLEQSFLREVVCFYVFCSMVYPQYLE